MVIVTKKELDKLDELLLRLSDIREPQSGRDSFGLYYESYPSGRLKKLLDEFDEVYKNIFDLFETWYDRSKLS